GVEADGVGRAADELGPEGDGPMGVEPRLVRGSGGVGPEDDEPDVGRRGEGGGQASEVQRGGHPQQELAHGGDGTERRRPSSGPASGAWGSTIGPVRKNASQTPPARLAIVVSRYNASVTDRLLEGALRVLGERRGGRSGVEVIEAPGSYELTAL